MSASETRILSLSPFASARLAFVSMPRTAWYWLDDLVSRQYPGGYKALMQGFQNAAGTQEDLVSALRHSAEAHCHSQMGNIYNLSNDNARPETSRARTSPAHPQTPDLSIRMPSVYQLFRFMAHPTYLTTVWERRNYHLKAID